jgi:hypothetical protein
MGMAYDIREAQGKDLDFIYDSFLKSYFNKSKLGESLRPKIFFKEYPRIIDRILSRSETTVACLKENKDAVIGYIITEPDIVHYCLVKEGFKQLGIAKALLESKIDIPNFTITHKTGALKPIFQKYPAMQFNPFLLYDKEI